MATQDADQAPADAVLLNFCAAFVVQGGEIVTGLQSVPVYKLPLMLSAPRKFSWENAFIDFSMADHDTQAAAEAEAKEAAMAAAAAESASGESNTSPVLYECWWDHDHCGFARYSWHRSVHHASYIKCWSMPRDADDVIAQVSHDVAGHAAAILTNGQSQSCKQRPNNYSVVSFWCRAYMVCEQSYIRRHPHDCSRLQRSMHDRHAAFLISA